MGLLSFGGYLFWHGAGEEGVCWKCFSTEKKKKKKKQVTQYVYSVNAFITRHRSPSLSVSPSLSHTHYF